MQSRTFGGLGARGIGARLCPDEVALRAAGHVAVHVELAGGVVIRVQAVVVGLAPLVADLGFGRIVAFEKKAAPTILADLV